MSIKIPGQGYACGTDANGNIIRPCLPKSIHQQVNELSEQLRGQRQKDLEQKFESEEKEKEAYIKKLGNKEYLDELWSKVDDEVESIHKRLGDTWNHPTCEEVTWFHDAWRRLYKILEEYQAAETRYLPEEEQPKTEEIVHKYGAQWAYKMSEPTTIISKAIEQVEQMGDYKVMVAFVDLDKSKPKEERLYTFTDIESKKLREVIYKEIEKEM